MAGLGMKRALLVATFTAVAICACAAFDLADSVGREVSLFSLSALSNGLFLVPPLAFNLVLTSRLPSLYSEGNAPAPLLAVEGILRAAVFAYPFLIPIDPDKRYFEVGLATYAVGISLYFASWAFMILSRDENLKRSPVFSLAPAYTPLVWLAGIAFMSGSALYPALSLAFVGTHVGEYAYRFSLFTARY